MRSNRLPIFLLLLALAAPLAAQVPPPPPQPARVSFWSNVLGEERSVQVRLPAGYERTTGKFPVLYLLDGDAQLTHTAATVEFLARSARMPEMIIIAISNTDRTRDFTPTKATFGEGPNARTLPTAGGADRFLTFLERELIPYVEKNYRALPYRVLAGHSFGGLFAMHSLFTKPDLFQARIAVSPTFGWDDRLIMRRFADFLRRNPTVKTTLFFSVGREGEPMERGYYELRDLLTKRGRTLSWGSVYLTDEDHGSVVLLSHYHGLRKVFEGWQYPFLLLDNETPQLSEVESHYDKLSQRLGFRIWPPEAMVNVIGYRLLTSGDHEKAIAAFKRNVELYPDSANVYDSLGEAYEKSGKLALAAENYARAVELGKKSNDANTPVFEDNLKRVKKSK